MGQTWNEDSPDETDGSDMLEQAGRWLGTLFDWCSKSGSIAQVPRNQEFSNHPVYGDEEQWRAVIMLVSAAGKTHSEEGQVPRRMTRAEALELKDTIKMLGWSNAPKIAPIMLTVSESAYNRRVFVTESGFLGLGPVEIKKGDHVVVFAGSRMPHIIRPVAKNYFELRGEAYVEGIMDGEAMQGQPVLETFQLV